jgi:hypothetical protein
MPRLATTGPPPDGGYPLDQQLHEMSDDGGPVGPDPARWGDPVWQDHLGEMDTFGDEVEGAPAASGGTAPRPPEPLPGPRVGTFSDPDFRVPADSRR